MGSTLALAARLHLTLKSHSGFGPTSGRFVRFSCRSSSCLERQEVGLSGELLTLGNEPVAQFRRGVPGRLNPGTGLRQSATPVCA